MDEPAPHLAAVGWNYVMRENVSNVLSKVEKLIVSPKNNFGNFFTKKERIFIFIYLFFFVLLMVFVVWNIVSPHRIIRSIALIDATILMLSVFCYQLIFILKGLIKLKDSSQIAYSHIRQTSIKYADLYCELKNEDKKTLELVKTVFDQESSNFIQRTHCIFGPIEKIGIIPGSVAAYLSYSKFISDKEALTTTGYEYIFYLILFFHFVSLMSIVISQKVKSVGNTINLLLKD